LLPFGSILTQLPLLIIGGLYMLYLGLVAVNKSREVADSFADSNEKTVIFVAGTDAPDLFSLAANTTFNSDCAETEEQTPVQHSYTETILFRINVQNTVSCHFDFSVFSRPPPVIINQGIAFSGISA